MKQWLTRCSILAGALLTAAAVPAQPVLGLEFPMPPPAAEAPQPAAVSDEEIETFATIYVELRETASRFEEEMASVESEEEAQEVQTRLQRESIEKLEQHGWTTDRFSSVAAAVNRSPKLTEKALQLIEEKS